MYFYFYLPPFHVYVEDLGSNPIPKIVTYDTKERKGSKAVV